MLKSGALITSTGEEIYIQEVRDPIVPVIIKQDIIYISKDLEKGVKKVLLDLWSLVYSEEEAKNLLDQLKKFREAD